VQIAYLGLIIMMVYRLSFLLFPAGETFIYNKTKKGTDILKYYFRGYSD
jgi:hypothetical protein